MKSPLFKPRHWHNPNRHSYPPQRPCCLMPVTRAAVIWRQKIHELFTATGFPRPMANPLVPSGIRGPGGGLPMVSCSLLIILFDGGVPTWCPQLWLLWWYWTRSPRPCPLPRPLFCPFLCSPSLSFTYCSPCQNLKKVCKSRNYMKVKLEASFIQKFQNFVNKRVRAQQHENYDLPYIHVNDDRIVAGDGLPVVSHLNDARIRKDLLPHSATPLHALFYL